MKNLITALILLSFITSGIFLLLTPVFAEKTGAKIIQQFGPISIVPCSKYIMRKPTDEEIKTFLFSSFPLMTPQGSLKTENSSSALLEINLSADLDNSLIITESGRDLWLIPVISQDYVRIIFAVIKNNTLNGILISIKSHPQMDAPLVVLSDLSETVSYIIDPEAGEVRLEDKIPSELFSQASPHPEFSITDTLSCMWNAIYKSVGKNTFSKLLCGFGNISTGCLAPGIGWSQCLGVIWGIISEWGCEDRVELATDALLCLDQGETSIKPAVATHSATSISSNSATLQGAINPNGSYTTAYFEWGTTRSYGNIIPQPPDVIQVGSENLDISVSKDLVGLSANRTYHYRLVAGNMNGVSYGLHMSFRTPRQQQKVATPVFSPAPGTFTGSVTVSISCATSGATIRYTTDGSNPTFSSIQYAGPVTLDATTALKAGAFKSGMADSDVATGTYAIVVSDNCFASVPSDHWKGEYFNNKTLSGSPLMVRDDGDGFIDFGQTFGSPSSACGLGNDNYSIRWTRSVNFSEGIYRFSVTSDDGSRLYVDNQLMLDEWFDQGPTTYTVDVPLSAGNHTIKLEYYEGLQGATANLSWEVIIDSFTGTWQGEWQSEVYDQSGGLTVVIHQNGSDLWGVMTFEGTPAGNMNPSYTGTVSGNEFNFTCTYSVVGAPHSINLAGHYSYNSNEISGGYTITGSVISDSGHFYIRK